MTEKTTKVCSKCKQEKPIWAFYSHKYNADGLQSYCKECQKAYDKSRYDNAKSKPTQSTSPLFAEFDALPPREIIAQIRERINYLRSKGWDYEGQLSYTETKIVKL